MRLALVNYLGCPFQKCTLALPWAKVSLTANTGRLSLDSVAGRAGGAVGR